MVPAGTRSSRWWDSICTVDGFPLLLHKLKLHWKNGLFFLIYAIFITKKMLLLSLWLVIMFIGKTSDRRHILELLQNCRYVVQNKQCGNNKKVLTDEERNPRLFHIRKVLKFYHRHWQALEMDTLYKMLPKTILKMKEKQTLLRWRFSHSLPLWNYCSDSSFIIFQLNIQL